jgi:hypothetical protein
VPSPLMVPSFVMVMVAVLLLASVDSAVNA